MMTDSPDLVRHRLQKPKAWKIISSTNRMGGDPNPLLKEFFLVGMADQFAALIALRKVSRLVCRPADRGWRSNSR
jgi:hypothetical protein